MAKLEDKQAFHDSPVFIYGPQGCGKTSHGNALANHYGKQFVLDYDSKVGLKNYPDCVLVLSNEPLPGAIPFQEAMQAAGLTAVGEA